MGRLNFCFRLLLIFSLIGSHSFIYAEEDNKELVRAHKFFDSNNASVYTTESYVTALEIINVKEDITKSEIEALRSLLEEQKIIIRDKRSLKRFLRQFKKELKNNFKHGTPMLTHSDLISPNTLNKIITHIIDEYRTNYNLEIKRSHKKSIHYLDQVLSNPESGKKDIKLLRKSLSSIGLPSHAYSEEFIKQVMLSSPELKNVKEGNVENYPTDKMLYEASQSAKNFFDERHYTNLQEQTKFINILKGFPAQLVVFQAAIGATIFTKHFYDSYAYDAKTNPEPLHNFMGTLTPAAAFSFFVFIMTSQYTQLGMYKLGMKWDSKLLKSAAPQAGLAFGFFASALFDEVLHDAELHQCVKQIMKPGKDPAEENREEYQSIAQTTPCESSYMEWVENKWRDYAVDLSLLLGASAISHKIVRSLTLLARSHVAGEALLTRAALTFPRLAGGVAFFVSIYFFMEVYRALDLHIGRRVKQNWTLNSIKEDSLFLTGHLNEFSWDQENEIYYKKVLKRIKSLGHKLSRWPKVHGISYETSFYQWNIKTNKILTSYGVTYSFLESIYDESQRSFFESFNIPSLKESSFKARYQNEENLSGLHIDHEKLSGEQRTEFIGRTCKSLANKNWLNGAIPYWKSICDNPETDMESNAPLVRDAKKIIYHILTELNKGKKIKIEPVESYLSENQNELFKPSVYYLKINQKLKIAELLLSGSLNYNIDIKYQAREVAKKLICDKTKENCNFSETHLKEVTQFLLIQKTTLSGLQLIKDIVKDRGAFDQLPMERFYLAYVLDLFKPYRKGQFIFEFINQQINQVPSDKSLKSFVETELSIYSLATALICGPEGDRNLKGYFQPPKLFTGFESFCTDYSYYKQFRTKEYLFKEPANINGTHYENGYLALEESIRNNFKTKEEFINFFLLQSKEEIESHTHEIVDSLNNVTDNFMIPGLINSKSEIVEKEKCSEILSYYNISRSDQFKGLEISLFQIRFWSDKLKEMKQLEGNFNEEEYKNNYCDFLELLKSYHDNFITGKETVTINQKETQEILFNGILDPNYNMLENLKTKYNKSVFINDRIVFYSFLQKAYPEWVAYIYLMQDGLALKNATKTQKIGYAIVKELEKSVQRYFEYLSLLRMKEGFNQGLAEVSRSDPALGF